MKKWLTAQPDQPATIDQLQALLDRFAAQYNQHRPHRSLPHRATPAAVYNTRPKATLVTAAAIPMTGSAVTVSTKPARSPCATTVGSTASASAEPTPEPAS
jgi:Integrase core domain